MDTRPLACLVPSRAWFARFPTPITEKTPLSTKRSLPPKTRFIQIGTNTLRSIENKFILFVDAEKNRDRLCKRDGCESQESSISLEGDQKGIRSIMGFCGKYASRLFSPPSFQPPGTGEVLIRWLSATESRRRHENVSFVPPVQDVFRSDRLLAAVVDRVVGPEVTLIC